MVGKAYRIPSSTDRLRKQQRQIKDLQAQFRNRNTPRPVSSTAFAGVSAAGDIPGTGNFLRTEGDTMTGPFALAPPVDFSVDIDSGGAINIGESSSNSQYSSNVQFEDIQPNTFVLDTIAGAAYNGQVLILRTFAPSTPITISQATLANGGNIQTLTDADFTMGDLQMIWLVFDADLIVFDNAPGGTWRVMSVSSGGGGITFPITPPVDVRGNVNTTQNIDLSATTAHSTTMTLTGNITITFSNIPTTATQIEWEVEIKQDGTGSRTVTWPASVTPTPVLNSAANSTTLVVLRVNDGGTIVRTLTSGGAGEVFTWSANHNANGFALVDGRIADDADPTKIVDFDLSGMTTGITGVLDFNFTTAKTITFSDAVGTVVLSPLQLEFDFNTFDAFDIDSLRFMASAGTLGSLNVGFSSLGSGGFRGNILNAGRFEWTEENTELMRLSEATSVTTLDVTGIVSAQINLAETTSSKVGTILQGSTTLQYTTTATQHEFLVGVESIAFITAAGIEMQGTNFILTPQIGFSILGNLIEDDAGGMIFTVVPTDDFTWDDGTDVFATLDKTLFAINAIPMQYTQIATPPDPGLITLGKVFFNTTTNRLNFRRRNDGDTAWVNIDLEASGGTPTKIEEGDSKVEVIDAGTGRVDVFVDSLATAKYSFNATNFSPVVAGGVNLGTDTLPWEKIAVKDIEIQLGGTLTTNENNIVADASGMRLNTTLDEVFTFTNQGTVSLIIGVDEIEFRSGRAHKIIANGANLTLATELITDSLDVFTGASRNTVTMKVEDEKTTWFTETGDVNAYALQLVQNNNTPLNTRTLANIDFIAENTINVDTIYARISASSQVVTSAVEDGLLQLGIVSGGTLIAAIDMEGSGSGGANAAKIGFFGETPVVQQSVASDTLANLYTALRNLGLIV